MSEKNMTTWVKMNCVGPDRYEGEMQCDGVTISVIVNATAPTDARIALWMPYGFGRNPCGSGHLARLNEAGGWTGEAEDTVGKRRWFVGGSFEGGELMFQAAGRPVTARKPVRKP